MKITVVIDTSGSMMEEPKPAILSLCARVIDQVDGLDVKCVLVPHKECHGECLGDKADTLHFGGMSNADDMMKALDTDERVLLLSDGGFDRADVAPVAGGGLASAQGGMRKIKAVTIGADADVLRLEQFVGRGNVHSAEDLLAALDGLMEGGDVE